MKKIIISILIAFTFVLLLTACGGITQDDIDAISMQLSTAENTIAQKAQSISEKEETITQNEYEISLMTDTITDLESQLEDADNTIAQKESEISTLTSNNRELSQIVDKYKHLSDSEIEAQTEANRLQAEKDRLEFEQMQAEQQKQKEAEERREREAREAEERRGYNTGITYNNLARTPDEYEGQKVKFTGRVLQVLEGTGSVTIRLATKGRYDNVIIASYLSRIVDSRVLEGDRITIYGTSQGLYTYESTGGANITIPRISIDKIDQ